MEIPTIKHKNFRWKFRKKFSRVLRIIFITEKFFKACIVFYLHSQVFGRLYSYRQIK